MIIDIIEIYVNRWNYVIRALQIQKQNKTFKKRAKQKQRKKMKENSFNFCFVFHAAIN